MNQRIETCRKINTFHNITIGKGKGKFLLIEQAMKTQRQSRVIAVLFP
jgi:hypothetical protein